MMMSSSSYPRQAVAVLLATTVFVWSGSSCLSNVVVEAFNSPSPSSSQRLTKTKLYKVGMDNTYKDLPYGASVYNTNTLSNGMNSNYGSNRLVEYRNTNNGYNNGYNTNSYNNNYNSNGYNGVQRRTNNQRLNGVYPSETVQYTQSATRLFDDQNSLFRPSTTTGRFNNDNNYFSSQSSYTPAVSRRNANNNYNNMNYNNYNNNNNIRRNNYGGMIPASSTTYNNNNKNMNYYNYNNGGGGILERMVQNAVYNTKEFSESFDQFIEQSMTPLFKRASRGTAGILRKGTNDLMRSELTPKAIDMERIVGQALNIIRYDQNAVDRIVMRGTTTYNNYDDTGRRRRRRNNRKRIELSSDGQSIVEYSTSSNAKIINGRRVSKTMMQMGVLLNYQPWSMWINAENGNLRDIMLVDSTTNKGYRVNIPNNYYNNNNNNNENNNNGGRLNFSSSYNNNNNDRGLNFSRSLSSSSTML